MVDKGTTINTYTQDRERINQTENVSLPSSVSSIPPTNTANNEEPAEIKEDNSQDRQGPNPIEPVSAPPIASLSHPENKAQEETIAQAAVGTAPNQAHAGPTPVSFPSERSVIESQQLPQTFDHTSAFERDIRNLPKARKRKLNPKFANLATIPDLDFTTPTADTQVHTYTCFAASRKQIDPRVPGSVKQALAGMTERNGMKQYNQN
jgi:hypothetical protein